MAEKSSLWITPFKKQCFVALGVSLNMAQMGLVMGFSTILLPQLKMPTSSIPIDDEYGSWIAAIPGIAVMFGNLTIPSIMGKFGRKIANLTTLILTIVGWICIVLASDVVLLLAARGLQGIAMGMISTLGPLLIGEYTSPRNRGAFLMTISIAIGIGVLAIHTMGSYLDWQTTSLICIAITILDLLMVISSPESPCWLANQGRFDECKSVFRWLRGDTEEDELEKMIEANAALRKETEDGSESTVSCMIKMRNNLRYFGQTIKKREFIKPIVIMIHIYAMGQWSGVNLLASYAVDFIQTVIGDDVNIPVMIISLDIQRIISNTIALIIIKKLKRKTMLSLIVGLNIFTLFIISAYTYAKSNSLIVLDANLSYYIGVGLIHLLTLTIAMGALPMSFILAGEIFPLQYKSMAGGVSCLFFSLNLFISLKTVPILISTLNIYGTYLLYCGLLIYFLVVVGIMLPETKDRTLQEIEDEFRGNKKQVIAAEKFTNNPSV